MIDINKKGRILFGLFFVFAGTYHFINPAFYLPLIPDYLPYKTAINFISGLLEILAGALLFTSQYSYYGGRLIVILMILFIPSHIYFIQIGSCVEGGLCVPPWVAWVRLILIHPLLIWFGWRLTAYSR